MKSIRRFKAFCLDTLAAIRELTAAISHYNERVSELHADIKKIEASVATCTARRSISAKRRDKKLTCK